MKFKDNFYRSSLDHFNRFVPKFRYEMYLLALDLRFAEKAPVYFKIDLRFILCWIVLEISAK